MNLLTVILFTAPLWAAQSSDQWLRSLQAEQDRIRAAQEKHTAQIAVNTDRIDKLETQGSPNLGKVNEHVNQLQGELDRHEKEDQVAKDVAQRNQEEWMRRFDIVISAVFTAALAMGGNVLFGWWKDRRHTAALDSIKDIQASDRVSTAELLKVSKDIADEVKRNNDIEARGVARDDRIKSNTEHIQGLEDREVVPHE